MGSRHRTRWQWLVGVVCCLTMLSTTVGCDKTPEQKLRQAKAHLAAGKNPGKAAKMLNSVLEAEPKNVEAKRLLAEVYRLRGEYKRAEELLQKLWEAGGFGDEAQELSAGQKNKKELIRTQFVDLYSSWAESLDPREEPEAYVSAARKGLSFNPKDRGLNKMLVDYYWETGQRRVEAGKKKAAAKAYEQILQLRTAQGDERREKAQKRARDLRLEFFMAKGRKRFEESGKSIIEQAEGLALNEAGDTIAIHIEQDVDRKLDPEKPADKKKAKQIAYIGLIDKLRRLTISVAGLPEKTDLSEIGADRAKTILLSQVAIEESSFEPGTYTLKATMPVEDVIKISYDIKTLWEDVQRKKGKEGEGATKPTDGDDKPADSPDATDETDTQ